MLIYVGHTTNPAWRMVRHAGEQPWWPEVARKTMAWYPTREEACAVETAVIGAESPRHNKYRQSNPNSSRRGFVPRSEYERKRHDWEAGLPVEMFPNGPVYRNVRPGCGATW